MTNEHRDSWDIRSATQEDVQHVMELIAPFVAQQMLLPRTEEELAKLTQHGFVADVANNVVGFAAIEIYSRKLAEIQCLAVSAPYQGRGIARQLIQCCVRRARENNVHELMAITASEPVFRDCGFDYALPDQKRALFIHPGMQP